MTDPTTITVPRPHVPYGPERVPANDADVNYLREAAHRIEGGYRMGSNLTATVVKLLHDAADAIKAGSAAPTADFAAGYAEAIARLRDDERYRDWWSSPGNEKPGSRHRQHLADYLEAVGIEGQPVT